MKKEMIFPSNITEFRRNEKKKKKKNLLLDKVWRVGPRCSAAEKFQVEEKCEGK